MIVRTDGFFESRNMVFIAVKRIGVCMVTTVANFPREVRDHERRVDNKANKVIDPAIVTEGIMITLMAYDPSPGQDTTLDSNVSCPAQVIKRMWKVLVYVISCNIVKGIGHEEILDEITKRSDE